MGPKCEGDQQTPSRNVASGVYGQERAFQEEGQSCVVEESMADELACVSVVHASKAEMGYLYRLWTRN